MNYKLTTIGIIVSCSVLFGILGFLVVEYDPKTPHENYCEQLKVWHPDCNIE